MYDALGESDPVVSRQTAIDEKKARLARAVQRRRSRDRMGVSGFVRRKWAWLDVDGARIVAAVVEIARVLAAMGGLPEQSRVVLQAAAGVRSDREALLPAEGGYVFVCCVPLSCAER
ncbi:hypothetical protein ACFWM5_31180 [Streptomyces bobili]|uniref:hypothetical protein n=1 Tax=Streptomyces bobili TaxID=67280 RepID=UPI00364FA109